MRTPENVARYTRLVEESRAEGDRLASVGKANMLEVLNLRAEAHRAGIDPGLNDLK